MTGKHTPGPLEVRSIEGVWGVDQVESLTFTALCPDGRSNGLHEISADEALANARLYAAAPDLLDALNALLGSAFSADESRLSVVYMGGLREKEGSAGHSLHERCDRIAEAGKKARAAIAKAKGRP